MDLQRVFPINSDGTYKHKLPCQTPGCKWPNWHICLDKADPEHYKPHEIKPKRKIGPMSQAQKDRIAQAARERHARERLLTKERDDLIIKHYTDGGLGMSAIASLTGYAQSTVNKVLNRAAREGVLKIRPKGRTLFRPGTN